MINKDMENLIKYPKAVFRFVFIIVNNIYCIPTYVIWMVMLLPLKKCNSDLYYKIEGILFHWLLAIVSLWSWSAGYDIIELGDDITPCRNKKTLVIANHQSTGDVPILMAAFNAKRNILPNIMWIMDRLFKYTNFGIVSLIHQDFFIASGKTNRDESVEQLKKHLLESYIPRNRHWMVLFPEGGFLRKRRQISQKYAHKHNLPVLKHVTLPRVGALKAIIEVLLPESQTANNNAASKTHINGNAIANNETAIGNLKEASNKYLEYILDITIAYPKGRPLDLPNIIHGQRESCQTHLFYRLYHCADIPKDTDALTKWLYQRFAEKEDVLEHFYQHENFDKFKTAISPTLVQQDMFRFVIINLFFITSSYFHLQVFYLLLDYYRMYSFSTI